MDCVVVALGFLGHVLAGDIGEEVKLLNFICAVAEGIVKVENALLVFCGGSFLARCLLFCLFSLILDACPLNRAESLAPSKSCQERRLAVETPD